MLRTGNAQWHLATQMWAQHEVRDLVSVWMDKQTDTPNPETHTQDQVCQPIRHHRVVDPTVLLTASVLLLLLYWQLASIFEWTSHGWMLEWNASRLSFCLFFYDHRVSQRKVFSTNFVWSINWNGKSDDVGVAHFQERLLPTTNLWMKL